MLNNNALVHSCLSVVPGYSQHSPAPTAYVRTNRDGGQGVVPKIVLARASSAGAAGQPGGLPDLDRARSGSGGLPGSVSVAPLHPQTRNSPIPQVCT